MRIATANVATGGINTAARPRMKRTMPSTRKRRQCALREVATAARISEPSRDISVSLPSPQAERVAAWGFDAAARREPAVRSYRHTGGAEQSSWLERSARPDCQWQPLGDHIRQRQTLPLIRRLSASRANSLHSASRNLFFSALPPRLSPASHSRCLQSQRCRRGHATSPVDHHSAYLAIVPYHCMWFMQPQFASIGMFGVYNVVEFMGAASHRRDTQYCTPALLEPAIANGAAGDVISGVPSAHARRVDFDDRHPDRNIDNDATVFDLEIEPARVR